jgi:predicted enzyme related to lactoylglutathione lyase
MTTQSKNAPGDRTSRPGKFVWFEHASTDPRKAQAFYAEVLGWKVKPWGDSSYEMILAGETLDTMIGGYTVLEHDRDRPRWISYVSVDDVDETAKAALANGGKLIEAPRDFPGIGRAATIADPQGAELSLFMSATGDPPDLPRTAPPPARRFFWCELHTVDPAKALSFYEQVLGFTHETLDTGGTGYHVLSKGGVGRAGVTGHLPSDVPSHWLPYVAVDDPDATAARAGRLGGTILVGPADIPGVGRFAVLQDPTSAVLAVMKAMPPNPQHEA